MKRLTAFFLLLCLCLGVAGCSSSQSGSAPHENSASSIDKETGAGDGMANDTANMGDTRKLIKTVELEMQTRAYDAFITSLQSELAKAGGYVQQSDIRGGSGGIGRNGTLTLRVPADELDAFLDALSPSGTVISRSEETQDVTLEYVDIESRLKALRAEQTALLALLEKAESLSDILTVQDKLTGVNGEIESYESRLRTMQTLIAYSTVNLHVYEVEKEQIVTPLGLWEEIGMKLSNNLKDVGQGLRAIFVWIVSSLPYLVIIAVLVVAVLLILRLIMRRNRRRAARPYCAPSPAASSAPPHTAASSTDSDDGTI